MKVRSLLPIIFGAAVFMAAHGTIVAQTPPPGSPDPDEIIRKFAAKEAEFRKAREKYTYRQVVKMEELDSETVIVTLARP